MAIDPTTPLTPIVPTVPVGASPDSVPLLQAMARAALANTANQLGEIVGRPTTTPQGGAPVEQAGQTSTQDAGHAVDTPGAKGAPPVPQTAAPKVAAETRMVRAVRTAAAEAVPRQAGLAPLMANVRAVVERPDMPTEVREAGRALLARTPNAAEITTPQGLKRAVERSGVFLEARMARAAVTVSPEAPKRPGEALDMKAALLVFRGALSAWLAKAAPQVLDIDPRAEIAAPPLPAAEGETALSTPTAPGPPAKAPAPNASVSPRASPMVETPEAPRVRTTVASGQEAPKTTPSPQATNTAWPTAAPMQGAAPPSQPTARAAESVAAPPTETPAEPEVAQQTAKPAPAPNRSPEDDAIAARFGSYVAVPKSSLAAPAQPRTALSALVQLGLMAEEAVRDEAPLPNPQAADSKPVLPRGYGGVPTEAARPKVPPPYAGGPMAGQKPAAPEVPVDISTTEVVRRLLKGTSGALARQDLMQIASLTEAVHHHEAEAAEARPQGARLNLDLPFVTPQGVAVAQFEISHDGGGSGGCAVGPAERTYKVRFSIDLEPLGPVHALLTLTGARARVSLWAERAETIARLRAGEESLGAALRQAELIPEVAVHSGAPSSAQGNGPLGHFVDQAS